MGGLIRHTWQEEVNALHHRHERTRAGSHHPKKADRYLSGRTINTGIEENPLFETVKAQKKLCAYVEGNEQTIAVKAEIMLDHFIAKVRETGFSHRFGCL
jgi:hypothetical protein